MYDATIIEARSAGSRTARLLARRGYTVLLLNRATLASDMLFSMIFALRGNEHLALIGVAYATSDLTRAHNDIERQSLQTITEHASDLRDLMQSGQRHSCFVGGAISARVRKAYGPDSAVVRDAGYQKKPCTAPGITEALGSADLQAEALEFGFSGRGGLDPALAGYEQNRNQAELPYYGFTAHGTDFEPVPPEMRQMLGVLAEPPEQQSRRFGLAHTG